MGHLLRFVFSFKLSVYLITNKGTIKAWCKHYRFFLRHLKKRQIRFNRDEREIKIYFL
jgi:hypothetical protein